MSEPFEPARDEVGVEVPLLPAQADGDAGAVGQLELPALPHTGDPRVDDALARLTELETLPVEEHLPVYRDVHRRLHETLADLDVG